jgi:RNA polymerase sigma factor (sigma-70 family)
MANLDRGIVFRELDRLFSEGTLAGLGDRQLLERYLTRRDEAAFEALVNLHGPMVLGLCRRILRDPRDIEDAFQATFLILVRKASAIRDRGLLSNWLYGVALKVATRARAVAMRRRGRERPMNGLDASARPESTDLAGIGQVLDQELSRLPVKYRVPLVMCYLRGQTHDQAAAELSWPVGTVRSRMARGRELLKARLTRRGYLPSATLLGPGPALSTQFFSEVVPQSLAAATVEGAFTIGASQTIEAGTAASVLALTQGVLTSMKLTQVKWIGLALMTATLSTGGAIVVASARSQSDFGHGAVLAASAIDGDELQDRGEAATVTTRREEPAGLTEKRLKALEDKIDELYHKSGMDKRTQLPALDADASTLDRLEAKVGLFWNLHGGGATKEGGETSKRRRDPNIPGEQETAKVAPGTYEASQTNTALPPGDPGQVTRARRGLGGGMAPDVPAAAKSQHDIDPRRTSESSGREIRELEEQLRAALPDYENAQNLHSKAIISARELHIYRNKVHAAMAVLQGMGDDLADEIESAELEIRKKQAVLDQAQAEREAPLAIAAQNARLNQQKPGMVSGEEVAKAEGELRSAGALIRVRQVELEETQLRLRHLNQRLARVQKVLRWAHDTAVTSTTTSAVETTKSANSAAEPKR